MTRYISSKEQEQWLSSCPAQDKGYGKSEFYKGEDFTCRYIMTRRGPFKSIYIPYGPNFKNLNGLKNFLDWLNRFKLTKVRIDLYRIFENEKEALSLIRQFGFKSSRYIQDPQTSIINKNSFMPNLRAKRYIRSAIKHHTASNFIKCDDLLLIKQIYKIYEESCKFKSYDFKRSFEYFEQLVNEGVLTVVRDNETGEINCFLLSVIRYVEGGIKKILYLVFTAMTETGRNLHLGFLAHQHQIEEVFKNEIVDQVDCMGFSKEKGKHNIFKTKFGNEIIDLSGSFKRFKIL